MPLYEYQCDQCGEVFELVQKFADEPLSTHEKCGGAVRRLISAPALMFKGSGWYVTDYAKGGNSSSSASSNGENKTGGEGEKKAAKEDSGSKPAASEASKPSTETKPAS